jgi:hypothetical protein
MENINEFIEGMLIHAKTAGYAEGMVEGMIITLVEYSLKIDKANPKLPIMNKISTFELDRIIRGLREFQSYVEKQKADLEESRKKRSDVAMKESSSTTTTGRYRTDGNMNDPMTYDGNHHPEDKPTNIEF